MITKTIPTHCTTALYLNALSKPREGCTPEVVAGDRAAVGKLVAAAVPLYAVGIQSTPATSRDDVAQFLARLAPGKTPGTDFAYLAVTHGDDRRHYSVHVMIPRVNLRTGKQWSPDGRGY